MEPVPLSLPRRFGASVAKVLTCSLACLAAKAYCQNKSVVPVSIQNSNARFDSTSPLLSLDALFQGRTPFSAEGLIVTNNERLAEMTQLDEAIVPVFGILRVSNSPRNQHLQIVGIKKNELWMSQVDETLVNLARIGQIVESGDARLEHYEDCVAGARLVVAFEKTRKSSREIEAVVRTASSFYSVKKLEDGAFSIERIGQLSR